MPAFTSDKERCLTSHGNPLDIYLSHQVNTFCCRVYHGGERLALATDLTCVHRSLANYLKRVMVLEALPALDFLEPNIGLKLSLGSHPDQTTYRGEMQLYQSDSTVLLIDI